MTSKERREASFSARLDKQSLKDELLIADAKVHACRQAFDRLEHSFEYLDEGFEIKAADARRAYAEAQLERAELEIKLLASKNHGWDSRPMIIARANVKRLGGDSMQENALAAARILKNF